MDNSIPDASMTETHLTLMTRKRAFMLFITILAFTVAFALLSFLPKNTRRWKSSVPITPAAVNHLSFRDKLDHIGPLNSFVVLEFFPEFLEAPKHNVDINVDGVLQFQDENNVVVANQTLSTQHALINSNGQHDIFYEKSFIDFSQIYISAEFSTPNSELTDLTVVATTLGRDLSITALVSISFASALVILMLIFIVSRRVRPSKLDHWMTVVISGLLILIDGPWLVCSYYALPAFSQVFDAMSQLFHTFFVIYCFVFFGVRAPHPANKIFKNPIVVIAILISGILLLILQFTQTDLMPLSTLRLISRTGPLYITTVVIFFIFHLSILGSFIYGFLKFNIERFWSLLLIVFMFIGLELIQIFAFLVRLFVAQDNIGISAAMDVFYILMANVVSAFLLYVNTPIARNSDGSGLYLVNHDPPL